MASDDSSTQKTGKTVSTTLGSITLHILENLQHELLQGAGSLQAIMRQGARRKQMTQWLGQASLHMMLTTEHKGLTPWTAESRCHAQAVETITGLSMTTQGADNRRGSLCGQHQPLGSPEGDACRQSTKTRCSTAGQTAAFAWLLLDKGKPREQCKQADVAA